MLFFALMLFNLKLSKAQSSTSNSELYSIIESKTEKIITINELAQKLNSYDLVFFGEQHNDSVAHVLQFEIYKLLLTQKPNLVLGMEMFEKDIQPIMDEYLQSIISEKHFKKDAKAWPNYSDYKPMIEYAKENKKSVFASNTPARYANLVNRKGIDELKLIKGKSKQWLPRLPLNMSDTVYSAKFKNVMQGHDDAATKNMFAAQILWDTGMAESIVKQLKAGNKNVYHLNGRFHSDGNMGIPFQVRKLSPKTKIAIISSFSQDDEDNKSDYSKLGDFVIITKAVNVN